MSDPRTDERREPERATDDVCELVAVVANAPIGDGRASMPTVVLRPFGHSERPLRGHNG